MRAATDPAHTERERIRAAYPGGGPTSTTSAFVAPALFPSYMPLARGACAQRGVQARVEAKAEVAQALARNNSDFMLWMCLFGMLLDEGNLQDAAAAIDGADLTLHTSAASAALRCDGPACAPSAACKRIDEMPSATAEINGVRVPRFRGWLPGYVRRGDEMPWSRYTTFQDELSTGHPLVIEI